MIYFIGTSKRWIRGAGIEECTIDYAIEYFKNKKFIQLDTETEGFDPYTCDIICWQIGDRDNQFVIEQSIFPISHYKEFFEDSSKIFLLQNAKFDLRFMLHNGIKIPKVYDTFLAEAVLTTGLLDRDLALDDLVAVYCGQTLNKNIRSKIHIEGLTNRVIEYAAKDVMYLEDIMNKQMIKINKYQLNNVLDLENEVVHVFAHMEYFGVLIDTEKWKTVAKQVENSVKDYINKLDNVVLEDPLLQKFIPPAIQMDMFRGVRDLTVNWNSSTQKLEILKALGLKVSSTGERILTRNKDYHRLIPLLLSYNKQQKLASSFGLNILKMVNKVSGRLHPNFWQIVSTGRISVKEPNVNQIPSKGEIGKVIRSAFIPRKGYKIVGGDYSAMELRVIAEFSKDPLWVDSFKNGEDLHSVLCSKTFDIPIDKVKTPFPGNPDLTYRDVQKIINFGLAYGMSEHKLSDTMQVSVEEAKAIINKFFRVVPKVDLFLTQLGELGKKRGYIRTGFPFRRLRWFSEYNASKGNDENAEFLRGAIERRSKNTPIQGSNGDIIKVALCKVYEKIENENLPVNIILSVYDEIQTECREDYAEEWCQELNKIMIDAAKVVIKEVPIVADCKVTDFWEK